MSLEPHITRALDALKDVGTVRGVCLARTGEVVANRFPFSDERLGALCAEVESVIEDFVGREREIERLVMGFDGGQMIIVLAGEWRLLLMHMIPDEADFVAKAARAFFKDHAETLSGLPDAETRDGESEQSSRASVIALPLDDLPMEDEPLPEVAARQSTPGSRHRTPKVVRDTPLPSTVDEDPEQLPLDLSPDPPLVMVSDAESAPHAEEAAGAPLTLRELLAASRRENGGQTSEVSLIAEAEEGEESDADASVSPHGATQDDEPSGQSDATVGVERSAGPRGEVLKTAPLKRAKPSSSPADDACVVGSVIVQPVRLAAHQPQSTLPPPKRPRTRKRQEA